MNPIASFRFVLTIGLLAALLPAARVSAADMAAEPPTDTAARIVTVGCPIDSYPISYEENGRLTGFAMDVIDAVARVNHWELRKMPTTLSDLDRRFRNGEFDLIATSAPTVAGLAMEFSDPYVVLAGAVFVRKDSNQVRTLGDLRHATLVLMGRSSVMEKVLEDHQVEPQATVHCTTLDEGLRMVESGGGDAVYASRLIAMSIIERDNLYGLKALPLIPEGYGRRHAFGVHAGDPAALLRPLNDALAALRRSGELAQIHQHWFGRFETAPLTREEAIRYAAVTLAIALALCIVALLLQRGLRRRLARQTAQLRESEALLEEAQRFAHLGHWSYERTGRMVVCSPEMLRILGREGHSGPISYWRLIGCVAKDERAATHRKLLDALEHERETQVRFSVTARTGAKKIVQLKAKPLRNTHGAVTGLVGTFQDVTQEKIFEDDLRTREQLLRAIYDNVPSGLGVVELAGDTFRFVSANPGMAKLLDADPSVALAGKLLSQLPLKSDAMSFWLQWFQRGLNRTEILKAEPTFGPTRRHFSLTLIPLGRGANGQPQVCFLVEDITERKQMDAEVAQGRRLRAVGELVGGIAHEFNNLLTPILLKAELLQTEFQNDARMRDELSSISRAAQRGADLTRRLLAFGRRSDPEVSEINVRTIVHANLDLLRPAIDRRIELSTDVTDDLPLLYLNAGDVHQIVMNLLLNARDTLMEKISRQSDDNWRAAIRIEGSAFGPHAIECTHWERSEPPVGWICLSVHDNGMGMPQHVLERIFEPFYTTKEVGKGTGLGLATVWHLVTRMGGKIDVQSQVGEGTEFRIWLPIVAPPKSATPRAETRNPLGITTGIRICLVEDDDLVAHTVAMTLRRQRHQVAHFRHGSDAWRHLSVHASSYDLLLLDLDLPGLNGMEIARRLRALRYTGKILVASGRLTDADAREFEKVGVDAHLEKPFSPQKLQNAVQACMSGTAGRVANSG